MGSIRGGSMGKVGALELVGLRENRVGQILMNTKIKIGLQRWGG